jgi:hypothetical protein
MKSGKAPGNDGLTVSLYRALWKQLKVPLMEAFEEGILEERLCPSQTQAIIRLIRKKDKDPSLIKNWRPISLMNVDVKLLSAALANRLKPMIPHLVSKEQLGFVQGRLITDGTKLLQYIVEEASKHEKPAIVAAIDFEKAFDSISHSYITSTLAAAGIPDYFIKCFRTLYNNAEASVINNSVTTRYFPVTRSCRQGDPIAPYLFILALDPLIRRIVNDNTITGYKTRDDHIKLSAYADDLTLIVKDNESLEKAMTHIKEFGDVSGLRVNAAKTEVLPLGLAEVDANWNPKQTITVTGITYAALEHRDVSDKENFSRPLAKLKSVLNSWKQRQLTLRGRTLVSKAQGISQLMYLSQTLAFPNWVHKEANTAIYGFIWKGPDKSTRRANQSDDERSLKISDTILMNRAHAVSNVGNLTSGARWTNFLKKDWSRGLRKDINVASSRFTPSAGYLPHNQFIVREAQALQETYSDIKIRRNSTVSNNSLFRDTRLKKLDIPRLERLGFFSVDHFVENGHVMHHDTIHPLTFLERLEWQKVKRFLEPTIQRSSYPPATGRSLPDTESARIMIADEVLEGNLITYKNLTLAVRKSRNFPDPPAWTKGETHARNVDNWLCKERYTKWGRNSKFLDFCFRLKTGVLHARKHLHRYGFVNSPECVMCGDQEQSVEHLLWDCPHVAQLKAEIAAQWGRSPCCGGR